MRFSYTRWQCWAVALAAGTTLSTSLEAATPKTANGNSIAVVQTAQPPGEDAPSVMMPPRAGRAAPPASAEFIPAPPTPPTPPTRSQAPRIADEVLHDEGVIHEDGGHYGHGFQQGPGFDDVDFNDSCLGPNCRTCSAGPVWLRADYILWWRSGLQLPPLVTTAPDGTPLATAGEIGQSTTSTLFGGNRQEYPVRPGGRIDAGVWLDQCETTAVGGRFYWLGNAEQTYAINSSGSPILAIPFTEGANGTQDARVIGFPGTFGGNIDFRASSEIFGGDLYAKTLWCRTDWGRIDVLGGYQYARINEGLVLDSTVTDLVGGASNRLTDTFDTRNEFHGGVIGVSARIDRCSHYVDLLAKVGLGNMEQTVDVRGGSITTVGNTTSVIPNSGLFAQPTNVGQHTRTQFVAIPELNANLGWHVTDCIDVNFGYTLIVFTGVAHPGNLIDTTINTSQIGSTVPASPARPSFNFVDSDLVLHGLNMGVTVKF
jgi:hypothetical protein